MKILLDENLPHELRTLLPGHDVFTVAYRKWSGTKNGALLQRAANAGFDVMLTMDVGVPYEQNLRTLPIAVLIISAISNDMDDLKPLVPQLIQRLDNIIPKAVARVP